MFLSFDILGLNHYLSEILIAEMTSVGMRIDAFHFTNSLVARNSFIKKGRPPNSVALYRQSSLSDLESFQFQQLQHPITM